MEVDDEKGMRDACFRWLEAPPSLDPDVLVQLLAKFVGLTRRTPAARIERAIGEELVDLVARMLSAMRELDCRVHEAAPFREAAGCLERALERGTRALAQERALESESPVRAYFPRAAIELASVRAAREPELAELVRFFDRHLEKHRKLERRIGWLVRGTTVDELLPLDPVADSDRIHHALSSTFRAEARILELLAINRIAVSASTSLFIRSTGEAEHGSVARFHDTYALFANFFEWGEDSKRGRSTVARINQIHGRYSIPHAEMKYILLQAAFTWLDGAERIAHRALFDVEKRGFFHAYVRLGRAMRIDELDDDYPRMYDWYREYNRAHAVPAPLKTETFETIVGNSLREISMPELRAAMVLAARVAMDDTYRTALGYESSSAEQHAAVRSVFLTLGGLLAALPRTPYLRSLQNTPTHSGYVQPDALGVHARSSFLPVIDAARPNGGFPENQRPIKSNEDAAVEQLPFIEWSEIEKHRNRDDLWVVIEGFVYDVTSWAARHPGGIDILLAASGRDASPEFRAAPHTPSTDVFKRNYRIGRVRTGA